MRSGTLRAALIVTLFGTSIAAAVEPRLERLALLARAAVDPLEF